MKSVFAIIITFNGENWIEKCLDSLINCTLKTNIIVIDNNSSDNTISIIEANYPSVKLIKSKLNLGFGKANNIGLKIAIENSADYVLLLNQDAWVENTTISTLISICEINKSLGILAPINLNPEGNAIEKGCEQDLNPTNCPDILSDFYLNKRKDVYYIKKYINASCWLITKECLLKTGGFDPLFSHYGEDVNYCFRSKLNGLDIGVATKAISYHARDNFKPKLKESKLLINKTKTNYLNNDLLIRLTDLNLNYRKTLIYEIRLLLYLIFKDLIRIRSKYLKMYFEILIFLFKNNSKLIKHRSIYLSQKSTFLH